MESTNAADLVPTIVTKRDDAITQATSTARTAGEQPDVQVIALPWWKLVLIRCARVYLQSLLGFLVAGSTGAAEAVGVPFGQFGGLFLAAASLAVAPAAVCLIQNSIELLTKLDVSFPTLRA